jgi:hypothetical protein
MLTLPGGAYSRIELLELRKHLVTLLAKLLRFQLNAVLPLGEHAELLPQDGLLCVIYGTPNGTLIRERIQKKKRRTMKALF